MNLIPLARAALAVVALLVLVACGSDASSTPLGSAASPGAVASEGSASQQPSSAPSGSAAASPTVKLQLPHADPSLEAQLPDSFEGKPLTKLSVDPITSAGNAGAESIRTLAKTIGDRSGNFSLAYASNPADPTFNCVGLRIPGAKSEALVQGFAGLTIQETRGAVTDEVTLAGKTVTHISDPDSEIGDTWFYGKGDTLYEVQAGSPERATELLKLLP
jgi:hypothetical protein